MRDAVSVTGDALKSDKTGGVERGGGMELLIYSLDMLRLRTKKD